MFARYRAVAGCCPFGGLGLRGWRLGLLGWFRINYRRRKGRDEGRDDGLGTFEKGQIDIVFSTHAPDNDAFPPCYCSKIYKGGCFIVECSMGFTDRFCRRCPCPLEFGEGIGYGDCTAHACASDKADDGSVKGRVHGREVWTFES